MTMVQVETVRGVENAVEICSVPGVDIVFILEFLRVGGLIQ